MAIQTVSPGDIATAVKANEIIKEAQMFQNVSGITKTGNVYTFTADGDNYTVTKTPTGWTVSDGTDTHTITYSSSGLLISITTT